jgi:hypothetical protein
MKVREEGTLPTLPKEVRNVLGVIGLGCASPDLFFCTVTGVPRETVAGVPEPRRPKLAYWPPSQSRRQGQSSRTRLEAEANAVRLMRLLPTQSLERGSGFGVQQGSAPS